VILKKLVLQRTLPLNGNVEAIMATLYTLDHREGVITIIATEIKPM